MGLDMALLDEPMSTQTKENGVHVRKTKKCTSEENRWLSWASSGGPGPKLRSGPTLGLPSSSKHLASRPWGGNGIGWVFKGRNKQRVPPQAVQLCLTFDSLTRTDLTVCFH